MFAIVLAPHGLAAVEALDLIEKPRKKSLSYHLSHVVGLAVWSSRALLLGNRKSLLAKCVDGAIRIAE